MELVVELLDEGLRPHYDSFSNDNQDSGVDLYMPHNATISARTFGVKVPLGLKACVKELKTFHAGSGKGWSVRQSQPYQIFPRSSTGINTPIRLSNSVGIIDAGYRGELAVIVDNISDEAFTLEMGRRYFQICHPSLAPIQKIIFDKVDGRTGRGVGGFGSTDKT